jgi:dihydrofolate reductase
VRASVYVGASLDGYIARSNGDIDWLGDGSFDGPNEDYGYKEFISSVDALVMGRRTYEKALTFGEWPYGPKPVVVLSSKGVAIPKEIARSVEHASLPPHQVLRHLSARGTRHVYVDGGNLPP